MNALTQEKLPVPQDAILFEERGAKGGVNVREIETELPPGHYSNISNLYLDDSGGLGLRRGYIEHSQLRAGGVSGAFGRGLGRFRASDGTNYLISAYWVDDGAAAIEIAYYDESLSSWTPIPFAAGIAPNVDSYYQFLMANVLLIMMNSLDRPLCWDGSLVPAHNIVYLGHQPASVAPTGAVGGAAGAQPDGWHWYILAFVNQTYGFVSSAIMSAASTHTVAPNSNINVTVPNQPTDPDVTHIRLYRSLTQVAATPAPPLSQFYFVSDTAIALPLPQVINDGASDTAIMANQTFLSDFPSGLQDHDLPPNMMSRACVHKSRLFSICENAGDQSVVFFSRPEWPAYHPYENNVEIDPGSGSNLKQLGSIESGVILFKDDRAGCLDTFGDPMNWEYRPVSKNGVVAPNSLKILQDPISGKMVGIRVALDGIYMTDGNVDLDIGKQVWPLLAEHGVNMLQAFSAFHEKRENLYIVEGVYYYNTGGSGGGGGPGAGGWSKPGWPPGVVSDPSLQSGFIFHLNHPIYDERGRFSGFAATSTTTHFMVHLDRLVPEDADYYGILYLEAGASDNRKVFRIWHGSEDDTEDIQFIAVTRKVSPNDKLTPVRFKNVFVRSQSLSALFGLTYSIDYGMVSGIFENLSAFLSDTFLDINIYDLMPALIFNSRFNGVPGLAAGDYFYRYRLGDAATPGAATMMTESSDIAGPFTSQVDPNDGIKINVPQLTDPWLETANDKGYTHFLIYRTLTNAAIDSTYYFCDNKAIGAAGTFNDQGQPLDPRYTLADPSAEIVWTMPTMKNIRLPRRGSLKAAAKGEFIQLIFSGLTDDPYLKFVAFGLLAKPKILR